jgi:hypothetical protein
MQRVLACALILVSDVVLAGDLANIVVRVSEFTKGDLSGWEEKSFKGHSQYDFVAAKSLGGKNTEPQESLTGKVLRARTQGQASGLFKEVSIDLTRTPYLNWSWRVQGLFNGNDEHSKEGDDYPARIYVVVSGGLFFWKTKAINYVWSSNQPVGSEWPNAYTENARMIAVRAGEKQLGQWTHERRNVREDLQRLFGEDVTKIDAVAVMVDGDNTGQSASSFFGEIFFSKD